MATNIISQQTGTLNARHTVIGDLKEDKWLAVMNKVLKHEIKTITAFVDRSNICLVYEDISDAEPISVPAKLLVILHNRFEQVHYGYNAGLTILTPLLLDQHVKKLEAFIIELAHLNYCDPYFIDWIEHENHFTNATIN